jgi:hypothetical protein
MMETRDSEKERPDSEQGSGNTGDALHERPFDGNLELQPANLLFTWGRIGLDHSVGVAAGSTQATRMCQCESAAVLVSPAQMNN